MDDFILSITKTATAFLLTLKGGQQVPLVLPPRPVSGSRLYQLLFTGPVLLKYQEKLPDRLLLYLPAELLDWPWQTLHDGTQPLALRHPIVLLPIERLKQPAPVPRSQPERLRILLTLALDEEHAVLGVANEQVIDAFEQRYADQVLVSKERSRLDTQRLLHVFQSRAQRFQIWHHVGPCGPDFTLKLADAAPGAVGLNHLLTLQPELRCFVLSTSQPAPAASVLSTFQVPLLLCPSSESSVPATARALQGFYAHVLTHDLAVASTLGCLEQYLDAGDERSTDWPELTMLAQTPELTLGIRPPALSRRQTQVPVTPIRMLLLAANPPGGTQRSELLRIGQEKREIKAAIHEDRRYFEIPFEEDAVRFRDFSRLLIKYRPMLLHFSGHAAAGALAFEKYADVEDVRSGISPASKLVSDEDLIPIATIAGILADYQDTLRCVVFNACETEALAEAVCEQIDCAIGMRGAIPDGVAMRFSELFYRQLVAGNSVGTAFHRASHEIALTPQQKQAEIFQLKQKPGVNPDALFLYHRREGDKR